MEDFFKIQASGTKIGLVEVVNDSGFSALNALLKATSSHAGVEVVRAPCPDLLKIPVCAKKMFSEQNADAVIAFAVVDAEEDGSALSMVQEKVIDAEIATGKLVFFAFVFDEDLSKNPAVGEQRLANAFEQASALLFGREPPATKPPATGENGVEEGGGVDEQVESGDGTEGNGEDEEVHSLF